MKKLTLFALSIICAFAIVLGFSFNDRSVNKVYATDPEGYVSGTTPTLGNTMFKISTDESALLLATAIQNVGDVYQVGYDITVSTGDVVEINTPTNVYFSSLTIGGKTWYPSGIFGDAYAEAKMIIWEIGYNPSYTYTIKAYANVGYRRISDNALFDAETISADEIQVEQEKANRLSQTYTLSFENGEESIDDKVVTIGSAIGELPEISVKYGYTADAWKIGGTTITAETTWNWYSNKTAVAAYTTNPVHDNSDDIAADFILTSDADYTIDVSDIDAGLDDIDKVIAVQYNGSSLTYTLDSANDRLVFGNAYVKAMAPADYVIDVYTATDTYRIKVAVVSKVITSVADLNAIAAAYGGDSVTNHTGYYILGNDIDGGTLTAPLSGYFNESDYETKGFRGIFDGRGHVISNLTLPSASTYKHRLFTGIGKGGIIRNLAFIDPIQTASANFVLAGDVQGATISNVIVRISSDKASAKYIINGTYKGTIIENSVFIMDNGQSIIRQKDDNSGNESTTLRNLAIVVGDPTGTDIVEGGVQIPGLCAAAYQFDGTYDAFKSANNIAEYTTINAMINALEEDDFIDDWDALISYANKGICLNETKIITPYIGLSAPSDTIYTDSSMTITAVDSTLELIGSIDGVELNSSTGVLSVEADVDVDTKITVRATSTIDSDVYEEVTVTVDFEPVNLTSDGIKDIELGSAISVANVEGSVIAIKTPSGSKVTLASSNVVSASELNSAAGVNCSEDLTIILYTASKAYKIRGAFITKIIRTVDDLNAIATTYGGDSVTNHTGYYILGNDIDGGTLTAPLSGYCSGDNYTTNGFRGIFDGRGHVIKNLTLPSASTYKHRLFTGIGKGAVIKNFAFIDPIQTASANFVFAGDVQGATISNVIVRISSDKASAKYLFNGTYNGTKIENSVFIMDGGQAVVGTMGAWGDHQTTISNLAIVIGNPTAGSLGNSAESFAGLVATHYLQGDYDDYKTAKGIVEFIGINAMITALESDDFIDDWDSLITYDDKGICLNGTKVITPYIGLTAPSSVVYAGGSINLTAFDATFSIPSPIANVSVNASTGELTVGAGVAADTEITVRATSTIDSNVYEEVTVTVDFEPEDLTSDGIKDIELGSAISVANVSGSVIAIKTPSGSKVTLASSNVVSASELNTAAGVNWSEDLTIILYTSSNAYKIRGAFITKIVRTIADLNAIANTYGADSVTNHTGYYILGNDIDGGTLTKRLSGYCSGSNYTTNGFRGIFDGRNHILKNITLGDGALFSSFGKDSVLKNIAIIDPVQSVAKDFVIGGETHNVTMINVLVKTTAKRMLSSAWHSPSFTNVVFITSNPEYGLFGDSATGTLTITNALVVSSREKGYYYFGGTENKTNVNVYANTDALLAALTATTFDGWDSPFTLADGALKFSDTKVATIAVSADSNEIYADHTMTIYADNATFSIPSPIANVSVDSSTGELTVGEGVAADTVITVRATSKTNAAIYNDITITVVLEPVDLTSDGIKDIELGSAISVANVSGSVIAIKTPSGSKVTLASSNVVSASELNTAAGVNWSEDLTIILYTSSKAYKIRGAFITKIIRTVADFNVIGANDTSRRAYATAYIVLGNDIDGTDQANVNALSEWCGNGNYTTTGFRGVFDGRGHVLKNLKLASGYLFWGLGNNAVVKNFALVDPVQVTTANYVLASGVCHATIENVLVKSTNNVMTWAPDTNPTYRNVIFITTANDGTNNKGLFNEGTNGTLTITNALVVTYRPLGHGYWGATESATNVNVYATTADLKAALTTSTFDGWDSPFTFDGTNLKFNGTTII